ncbi:putative chaperone-modulator protein CbpM [Legionella birminghamensis]|uniref:Chaperone-modulator protein CbpM n=1 Tax=Legionella birminghamensis TaxID=28083 RepID=A0A378I557_9GAMM|nr:chaperone modulator CbpM [Legionella birminghamensis]KTC70264.1 putative chaperone-modulator protein CbpM [Legionella birminghamensis]STX30328.1 putative chaperone-modulator protein CbpM [Legionella birminghamensis]
MDDKQKTATIESEHLFSLSLQEISHSFGVTRETIIEIVQEGIVTVDKNEKNEWLFDDEALSRIRTVIRLNKDLGVNLAGAGLVLDLLAEIDQLRALLYSQGR